MTKGKTSTAVDTPTSSYARMSRLGFKQVSVASGILGNPHGLRVHMGGSLVTLATRGEHKPFFKALGAEIKGRLHTARTLQEKASNVVNHSTDDEVEAFAETLSDEMAVKLQALLDKKNAKKPE